MGLKGRGRDGDEAPLSHGALWVGGWASEFGVGVSKARALQSSRFSKSYPLLQKLALFRERGRTSHSPSAAARLSRSSSAASAAAASSVVSSLRCRLGDDGGEQVGDGERGVGGRLRSSMPAYSKSGGRRLAFISVADAPRRPEEDGREQRDNARKREAGGCCERW